METLAFSEGLNGSEKEFRGRVLKLDNWRRIVERMCLNTTGEWEDSSNGGFHSSFPNYS